MVRTPPPRVSHDDDDPHNHSYQDSKELHHHHHQTHEWMSARGFDVELSGSSQHSSAPVWRHARLPCWGNHEHEQRDHGPPSRYADELSTNVTRGRDDMRRERTAGISDVQAISDIAAATDRRYPTAAIPRVQYQGSSSTRTPNEMRCEQCGVSTQVPAWVVGSPANAMESKAVLSFIMHEREQPFGHYARVGTEYSTCDLDSRCLRASPRTTARVAVCRPSYDSLRGLEEKLSVYDSTFPATYSPIQPQ